MNTERVMAGLIRFVTFGLLLLVIIVAALFVSFNDAEVVVWLGRDFAPRPLGQWLIWSFVAGALMGLLLGYGLWRRLRYRLRVRQLEARIRELERGQGKQPLRDTL